MLPHREVISQEAESNGSRSTVTSNPRAFRGPVSPAIAPRPVAAFGPRQGTDQHPKVLDQGQFRQVDLVVDREPPRGEGRPGSTCRLERWGCRGRVRNAGARERTKIVKDRRNRFEAPHPLGGPSVA